MNTKPHLKHWQLSQRATGFDLRNPDQSSTGRALQLRDNTGEPVATEIEVRDFISKAIDLAYNRGAEDVRAQIKQALAL